MSECRDGDIEVNRSLHNYKVVVQYSGTITWAIVQDLRIDSIVTLYTQVFLTC